MQATRKHPEIERILDLLSPRPRRKSIEENVCAFCGEEVTGFRDELSEREYHISGLCQRCQDETFGRR
jgi:hypothetical protein